MYFSNRITNRAKMLRSFFGFSVAILLSTTIIALPVEAQRSFGPITNPANGNSYYLIGPGSWTDSQAFAVSLGGNLVTINDAAENAWVFETFGGENYNIWIGLHDTETEGVFVWVSGETSTYRNWNDGEPNDQDGEDYVHMWRVDGIPQTTDAAWNDVADVPPRLRLPYGVVEVVVPEPQSLALALVAMVSLARSRRM